ncbi:MULTISPECIES: SDR family oxidoreductase [Mycobacteriaceae]|uniref:SDR family NAD(P)-dependent oxidoreductase n=1 Tax=Mycobacteriaceae TaxID=1762 RepID=UPI0007FF91BC|nr:MULTISPECIES: SDR family NAD(P)-dependent oxidoreductase [Mycobacteriaceae]MCK0175437.1 SDR family NAD(P)-dependent oxidoreductase [Mycolicibacterium sp. F2034L]OBB59945.1 short-chain dehydrogenase [Mycobacterium sp. 852013-51886_SCH5428379]
MELADKVFVVTGAGNGMGRQVARQLLARGAHVAAADLDQAGLAGSARHARLSTHVLDVTDRSAVAAFPEQVLARHGRVDGLVNIAGVIHRFAPFTDLSERETDRIMAVNFTGTVNMCRAFLPHLLTRPEANLTNMSSLSALLPFASQTLYSASKGAVKQFSEGLYAELCDTNVHVTTIFPGNISTELTRNSGVEMLDAGDKKVRATSPEAAGAKIVDGIARDRFRVLVGTDARLLDVLSRLSARRTTRLVAKQIKSVL